MRTKINSYGKTWHVWNTGSMGRGADTLPLGKPMLAWSFNRDGEAQPGLIQRRDEELDVNTSEVRQERQELVSLAKPQDGVDALKDKFPGPTQSIAGVVDKTAQDAADTHAARSSCQRGWNLSLLLLKHRRQERGNKGAPRRWELEDLRLGPVRRKYSGHLCRWQREEKRSALPYLGFHPNPPAMLLDNLLTNRQPDAGPGILVRVWIRSDVAGKSAEPV